MGFSPYRYSGFFGLNSIGFVAPFPSTFATAVAFGTLVAALRYARTSADDAAPRRSPSAPRSWSSCTRCRPRGCSLALLAVAVSRLRDLRSWAWALGAAVGLAVGLCLLWPYYSVVDLVRDSSTLEALNESMYTDVLLRIFPALLGLVVIVRRSRADHRDLLGLFLAGSVAICGRSAPSPTTRASDARWPFVVVVLDVALADGVARIEASTRWRDARRRRCGSAPARSAGLLLLGVVTTRSGGCAWCPSRCSPPRCADAERAGATRRASSRSSSGSSGRTTSSSRARASDNRVIPALAGRTLRPRSVAAARSSRDADARGQAQRSTSTPPRPRAADGRSRSATTCASSCSARPGRRTERSSRCLRRGGAVVHRDDDRPRRPS